MKITNIQITTGAIFEHFIIPPEIKQIDMSVFFMLNTVILENKYNKRSYIFHVIDNVINAFPLVYQNTYSETEDVILRTYSMLDDNDKILIGTEKTVVPFDSYKIMLTHYLNSKQYENHTMYTYLPPSEEHNLRLKSSILLSNDNLTLLSFIDDEEVEYAMIYKTTETNLLLPITIRENKPEIFYNFTFGMDFALTIGSSIEQIHDLTSIAISVKQIIEEVDSYISALSDEDFLIKQELIESLKKKVD